MIVLIALAVLFIYFALLYVTAGAEKMVAPSPIEPRPPKVLRNVGLSLGIFVLLDGIIFHSGLYGSLFEPKSNAGRVMALVHLEKQRPPTNGKEILVLGDSRMGIGFSEELANAIAADRDIGFFNRSMPESLPRLWYYMLREIDPFASRYRAIVMPLKLDVDPAPLHTALVHISQTGPLLRYTDAFAFAASFDSWSDQSRAFVACLLRGSAYQADLLDFLQHPLRRMSHLKQPWRELPRHAFRKWSERDVVGIDYDALTHELKVPERLSKRQRNSIQSSIQNTGELARSANCSSHCYDWTKRIVQRYDSSATSVVLVHLPKGPLAAKLANTSGAQNSAREALRGHKLIMFDPAEFAFLEQPAYYMDGSHLNEKGQEQFTRRLTEDLLAELDSRNAARAQAASGAPVIER
jgi:hypothetical protein